MGAEFASGGAVVTLATIAFGFYRYVWKTQQDRMDAWVAKSEAALEERLEKTEGRIEVLERELEQCHSDHRTQREENARLRLAMIRGGLEIPDLPTTG